LKTAAGIFFMIFAFSLSAAEFDEIAQKAREGDVSAQSQLGYYYLNGIKTEKNLELAKSWLQKAADQGDISAAYDLGALSEEERNYLSAARFYKMAESDPHAKLRLARLYSEGLGVVRDEAAAAQFIIDAAESGETEALYLAGSLYLEGRVIPQDLKKGENLLISAANHLYPPAYTKLGRFYEVEEKDDAAAEAYYQKAADAGVAEGARLLGAMIERNLDYKRAALYYTQAADNGDIQAASKLGHFYENGIGVVKNYKTAAEYYMKSIGSDGGFSENRLAAFYRDGFGVEVDPEMAREWYIKSIKLGYALSYKPLGYMYILGNFGEVNQVRGCAYLYKTGDDNVSAYCDSILSPRAQKAAKNLELIK
jgi:TPR repeat protein